MLRVASNFMLTLNPETRMTCAQAVALLAKDERRWQIRSAGAGSKGQRWYARAWIATVSPRHYVLVCVWKAAEDLHPTQPGRAAFVARTARDLLEHHPARAIADLTGHYDTLAQAGNAAPGLKRCIDYLTAKQPYLIYQIALTMGWPIATG